MLMFLLLTIGLGTSSCALECQLNRFEQAVRGFTTEQSGPQPTCSNGNYCVMVKYGDRHAKDIYIGCSIETIGYCDHYLKEHKAFLKNPKKPVCVNQYHKEETDKKGITTRILTKLDNGKTVCCCTSDCFGETIKNTGTSIDAARKLEEIIRNRKKHINPFHDKPPTGDGESVPMSPGVAILLMVCVVMKNLFSESM